MSWLHEGSQDLRPIRTLQNCGISLQMALTHTHSLALHAGRVLEVLLAVHHGDVELLLELAGAKIPCELPSNQKHPPERGAKTNMMH